MLRKRYKMRYKRRRTMRRRRKIYKKSTRPEVKFVQTNLMGSTIAVQKTSNPGAAVYQADCFGTASADGLLAAITTGTQSMQRIGNKIFLKKIVLHMTVWLCPLNTDTATYDSVIVRLLLPGVGVYYGGADVDNFWYGTLTNHVHDFIRRSNVKCYLDRTFTLQAQTPISGTGRTGKGALKRLTFSIPFNRVIEYAVSTNSPKYLEDRMNFNAFAFSPDVAGGTQIVCHNSSWRLYYTDP